VWRWRSRHVGRSAEFPTVYNSEPDTNAHRLAAGVACQTKTPPGFKATVFAAELDVKSHRHGLTRGRLWIAENYTYADRMPRFDPYLRDRIRPF
jgi:hypothetical protein